MFEWDDEKDLPIHFVIWKIPFLYKALKSSLNLGGLAVYYAKSNMSDLMPKEPLIKVLHRSWMPQIKWNFFYSGGDEYIIEITSYKSRSKQWLH